MKRLLALQALVLLALPTAARAQQAPAQANWFTVYTEYVIPANQATYDGLTRDFIKLFADAKVSNVSWVAESSLEGGYFYVIPGKGPTDFASMGADWAAATQKVGQDKLDALSAKSDPLVDHRSMFYIMLRPDLSYKPETVGFETAKPMRHLDYWYVMPGKEKDLESVAKEFVTLYKTNGIERGWRVYQAMTGDDLPLYLVVQSAKDEHDFYMTGSQIDQKIGKQADALFQKARSVARRVEQKDVYVRPDLSYPTLEVSSSGE